MFLLLFFNFSVYLILFVKNCYSVPITSNYENLNYYNIDNGLNLHPDTGLDLTQYLQKYKYPLESHSVTTEDGYILTIHRIPYGRNNQSEETDEAATNRPVVFLQHGLLCSSMNWIMNGPEQALALLLADAGYDVWLGNSRGNTYSRKHVSLDPDQNSSFWEFSYHEMGIYDLPAMIDYILEETKKENLTYVGHSQGTTQFFIMASERVDYNEKLNLMIALAPVVYLPTANILVGFWAANYDLINLAISALKIGEIFPHSQLITDISNLFCNDKSGLQDICADFLFLFGGFDSWQLNKTFITVLTSNTPAGASIMTLSHFIQDAKSGAFRQYDYGTIKNLSKYRSFNPPDYAVNNVTAPVALYYSQNDWFASVENVKKLSTVLPNVISNYQVDFEFFSHLDFLYANDVKSLVYDHVLLDINKVNNKTTA